MIFNNRDENSGLHSTSLAFLLFYPRTDSRIHLFFIRRHFIHFLFPLSLFLSLSPSLFLTQFSHSIRLRKLETLGLFLALTLAFYCHFLLDFRRSTSHLIPPGSLSKLIALFYPISLDARISHTCWLLWRQICSHSATNIRRRVRSVPSRVSAGSDLLF